MNVFANHRSRFVVGGIALAATVVVAGAVLLALRSDTPSQPGAAPPSPNPSAVPTATGTASVGPTTGISAAPSTDTGDSTEIAAVARSFMVEVVGFTTPVSDPVRRTGSGTATVDFHPVGPNGTVTLATTTVFVRRNGASWMVTGTASDTIRVDEPVPGQVISTPVRVSGQALAFEGTVNVRVLEPAGGRLVEVGSGVVTGGGDVMAPFGGTVAFRQPSGGPGWMVFAELSAVDGSVMRATTIAVSYPVPATP